MTQAGLRKFILALAALASVTLVAGFAARLELDRRGDTSPEFSQMADSVGGAFVMTDVFGRNVTEKTYAGQVWMLFVGFTNCPDICPTTLAEMSGWLEELGSTESQIRGLLVTVDPERDTPEILRDYISAFDRRITALVPSPDELQAFAENYKINYAKVILEGGDYTMDHTAGVFLFDRMGEFRGTIDLHEDQDVAIKKLRNLLDEPVS